MLVSQESRQISPQVLELEARDEEWSLCELQLDPSFVLVAEAADTPFDNPIKVLFSKLLPFPSIPHSLSLRFVPKFPNHITVECELRVSAVAACPRRPNVICVEVDRTLR